MDQIINGALFALGFTAVQVVISAAWFWFFLRPKAKDMPGVFEHVDTTSQVIKHLSAQGAFKEINDGCR